MWPVQKSQLSFNSTWCKNRETHLRTGIPVTDASRNAVYQIGSIAYLRRRVSLTMLLYGSSNRYGSRLFVSICACARKKGWNAPTWYHRTNMSRSGFPKNPPTSATGCGQIMSEERKYRMTHTRQKTFLRCRWPGPSGYRQPCVPRCRGCRQSTLRRNVASRRRMSASGQTASSGLPSGPSGLAT